MQSRDELRALVPNRDPLRRSTPVPFVEEFYPMGSTLRLETNSQEILHACRLSFGRYKSSMPGGGGMSLHIRLLVDESFEESPPWAEPIFRGQGDLFYVSVGTQNTAVAQLDRNYAAGYVSPAMARDTSYFRKVFVDFLVLTALTHGASARYSCVHASAVSREGRGVLLNGPSRSGKSTIALACARRGFSIVSDDVVYLTGGSDSLCAWGRPWQLRLLPDSLRFFPELKQCTRGSDDCIEIEIESVLAGRTNPQCRPVALLFLERVGGPTRLEPVSEDDALRRLSQDLIDDVPGALERHHRHWLELVRTGAYRLCCGEDPNASVDLVEQALRLITHGS